MTRIITISRQFGSGGRELGKRLSDFLHVPIYDHEIIEMLAEESELTPEYVASLSEQPILPGYAETIGRRFTASFPAADRQLKLIRSHEELLRGLARHDCIIVGRAADIILSDMEPLNIFVCADMHSRVSRCSERAPGGEELSPEQLMRMIRRIDKQRAAYRSLFSDTVWGAKENYTLCVNTTGLEIKRLVPALARFAEIFFGTEGKGDD